MGENVGSRIGQRYAKLDGDVMSDDLFAILMSSEDEGIECDLTRSRVIRDHLDETASLPNSLLSSNAFASVSSLTIPSEGSWSITLCKLPDTVAGIPALRISGTDLPS